MIIQSLRNIFVRNWGLKLFSLVLAVLLWLVLVPEEKVFSERRLALPLDLYSIPANMELLDKDVSIVEVTIRAPNRLMDQISSANVFAKLNLQNAAVIQQDYPLNPSIISAPSGAQVINVTPNKVRIRFERSKELALEVEPTLVGQLRSGLRLERVESIPARIPVRGPESMVREKDKIYTIPIDISGFSQTTEVRADLILPRPETRLPAQRTSVTVRLVIVEDKKPAAAGRGHDK
jgi:YbbR domain-containing protein